MPHLPRLIRRDHLFNTPSLVFHCDRVDGLELGRKVEDGHAKALVESALKEVERIEDQSWRIYCDERYS